MLEILIVNNLKSDSEYTQMLTRTINRDKSTSPKLLIDLGNKLKDNKRYLNDILLLTKSIPYQVFYKCILGGGRSKRRRSESSSALCTETF